MSYVLLAGWLSCIGKSMAIWTSRWTCPGFMFIPRKPHPVSHECHTIAYGLCDIFFGMEIVEGKDKPK